MSTHRRGRRGLGNEWGQVNDRRSVLGNFEGGGVDSGRGDFGTDRLRCPCHQIKHIRAFEGLGMSLVGAGALSHVSRMGVTFTKMRLCVWESPISKFVRTATSQAQLVIMEQLETAAHTHAFWKRTGPADQLTTFDQRLKERKKVYF